MKLDVNVPMELAKKQMIRYGRAKSYEDIAIGMHCIHEYIIMGMNRRDLVDDQSRIPEYVKELYEVPEESNKSHYLSDYELMRYKEDISAALREIEEEETGVVEEPENPPEFMKEDEYPVSADGRHVILPFGDAGVTEKEIIYVPTEGSGNLTEKLDTIFE